MRRLGFVIAMLLTLTVTVLAQSPSPSPSPKRSLRERMHIPIPSAPSHPEVRSAVKSLQVARKLLEREAADKAGHRDKAIKMINQSITECQTLLK